MTDDTPDNSPVAEKPSENAAVVGSPALPQDELKLPTTSSPRSRPSMTLKFRRTSTSWG